MILCIESSADPTVIGVVDDNGKVLERVFAERDRFADEMQGLLAEADVKPAELRGIAIGIGPGSFTGLRVSLAFAKGLARGATLPIWPVSSLKVVAANLQGRWPAVAVISPARRQHAHLEIYDGDSLKPIRAAAVVTHEDLAALLPEEAALIGPGVAKLTGDALKTASRSIPLDNELHRPHVLELAKLAFFEWHGKEPPEIGALVPQYGLEFGS